MKLQKDPFDDVLVLLPDDPEELIPVDTDDAEAMEETRPRMIVTPEEARAGAHVTWTFRSLGICR